MQPLTLICEGKILRSWEVILESRHASMVDVAPDGLVRDVSYRQSPVEDALDVGLALVEAVQLSQRKPNQVEKQEQETLSEHGVGSASFRIRDRLSSPFTKEASP